LVGHVALDRQKHGVSLKTERTAKAEINRLRMKSLLPLSP
jgi:hypothetical protein